MLHANVIHADRELYRVAKMKQVKPTDIFYTYMQMYIHIYRTRNIII